MKNSHRETKHIRYFLASNVMFQLLTVLPFND